MQPLVTIITSCYNHEKYLDDYFQGLFTQTYPNIELILFDDGSSDASWPIIESYIPRLKSCFPSVICERHDNIGSLRERALAMTMASGDLICMLDSDDYYLPDKIQENVDYLSVHPEVGVVYSDYHELIFGKIKYHHHKRLNIRYSENTFDDLCRECFIAILTVCFRAELLHKYVNYEEYADKAYGIGDYTAFLTLANHTEFGYIDKPLAYYRHVKGSLTHPAGIGHKAELIERMFRISYDYMNIYKTSPETKKYVEGLFSNYSLLMGFLVLFTGKPIKAWTYFRNVKLLAAIAWLPANLIKVLHRRFFS